MSNDDEARSWHTAFEAVALEHVDFPYNVAMSFTRNPDEAQDLVQETYCKAYRFFHRFQLGTNIKVWLVTIVRHATIHAYRKASRRPVLVELEQIAPLYATSSLTPEWTEQTSVEAFLQHEVQDEVKQAIDAFPEAFRLAVILADLSECSSNEIATILGCPVGTVMSRLFRGRERLRTRLRTFARASGYICSRHPRTAGPSGPDRASEPRRPIHLHGVVQAQGERGREKGYPLSKGGPSYVS